MDAEKEMEKIEEEIELVDNDFSYASMEDENNVDEEEESNSEEPQTEEIEELIAELLEVESKAAEAQETLEEESLVKVEKIDDVDDTSNDPFVVDAIANESDLHLTEEQNRNFIKVKEEDDANADLKLHNRLKRRRRKQLKEDDEHRILYPDLLPLLPQFEYTGIDKDGKVTLRGSLNLLKRYKEYLTPQDLATAEEYPQIGNFLKLNFSGQFKGGMYHQLMLRMCKVTPDLGKYERWFVINGKPMRLSAMEFSIVSGLRFRLSLNSRHYDPKSKSRLRRRYWPLATNKTKITEEDVEKALKDIPRNENTLDRLKLVYVLIISTFILNRGLRQDVPLIVFQLCDNLRHCEKYSWGEWCWNLTVGDVPKRLGNLREDDPKRNWNAYGCPWIILFWMFEVIGGMDHAYNARKIDRMLDRHPRMLRWDVGFKGLNNDDCKMFLDGSDVFVIPRLTPTYKENQEPYLKKMEKWMTDNTGKSEIYRCLMTGLGSGPVIIKDKPAPRGVDEGHEMNIDEIHVPDTSPTQCNAPQTTPSVETPPAWAVQLLQGVQKNEQTLKQVLEELQELNKRVSNLELEVDRGVEAHSARAAGHTGSRGQEQGSYVALNDSKPLPPRGVNVNDENDDSFMFIDDYMDTQVDS